MSLLDDTSPRLMVLGAGPPQLGLLEAARAAGIWIAVCDRDPAAPGFALADRRCILSTEDEPALERLAAALAPDGLIAPGRDRSTAVAARIADKLGIRHPLLPATAALCANKIRQREALAAAGVPQPRWQVASTAGEELELSVPLVVKVVDRRGQTELRFVEDEDELDSALAEAREQSRGGPVIVEEYLEGPDLNVCGFSAGGDYTPLLVSDLICAESPAFGVPLSAGWPSPQAQPAAEVARRAIEALGITEGPSQVRLRVSRGGPEVLQVSARLGANHEAELVELATGIDLNRLALGAALGRAFPGREERAELSADPGGVTVRFLLASPGMLDSVELPQGLKGVVRSWSYRRAGHAFGPLRRPSDRAGAVLVVGASREEADARAESASEHIRFLTADAEALV